jgi:ammonia channel protein AmtB
MAQQSGVDDVLSAVSGKQKGGIIGAVVGGVANTGLRALGMPVPAVNSMPPPPPGR